MRIIYVMGTCSSMANYNYNIYISIYITLYYVLISMWPGEIFTEVPYNIISYLSLDLSSFESIYTMSYMHPSMHIVAFSLHGRQD